MKMLLRSSTCCFTKLFCRRHFQASPPFLINSLSNILCSASTNNPPKSHRFYSPNSPRDFKISRHYSAGTDREVDRINLKFAEAREEIESAMDSKETVYFNEEAECARAAVNEVLDLYGALLKNLPETERAEIQRGMGLKMEQLKAELQQLNE